MLWKSTANLTRREGGFNHRPPARAVSGPSWLWSWLPPETENSSWRLESRLIPKSLRATRPFPRWHTSALGAPPDHRRVGFAEATHDQGDLIPVDTARTVLLAACVPIRLVKWAFIAEAGFPFAVRRFSHRAPLAGPAMTPATGTVGTTRPARRGMSPGEPMPPQEERFVAVPGEDHPRLAHPVPAAAVASTRLRVRMLRRSRNPPSTQVRPVLLRGPSAAPGDTTTETPQRGEKDRVWPDQTKHPSWPLLDRPSRKSFICRYLGYCLLKDSNLEPAD